MNKKFVHPSMERVYQATNLSSAEIWFMPLVKILKLFTNWENRGISKAGAFKVSSKFKIDLGWILSGAGSPKIQGINFSVPTVTQRGGWVPVKSYSKMGYDGYYTEMGHSRERW